MSAGRQWFSKDNEMTARLNRLNHIGMTVRDLDRSLGFYRKAFGLEPLFQGVGESPDIARSVGLDEARIRYAFLDLGNTRIELLQYEQPLGRAVHEARNCDVGAFHVCFDVDDLTAKYEQLRAMGIEFITSPIRLDDDQGALAGLQYVYFKDPDGLILQLYEMPKASVDGPR
jgi:catechol 2,3-dioxygenase-like lactoylglutathione lyase family enzyme